MVGQTSFTFSTEFQLVLEVYFKDFLTIEKWLDSKTCNNAAIPPSVICIKVYKADTMLLLWIIVKQSIIVLQTISSGIGKGVLGLPVQDRILCCLLEWSCLFPALISASTK